ncbi:MAG: hypothetical protein LAO31_09160 [Acidobacteriia bacterium]|nr:hypothetical protein [Terriglobia bacterium]
MRTHSAGPAKGHNSRWIVNWTLVVICGLAALAAGGQTDPHSSSAEKAARVNAIFQSLQAKPPEAKHPPRDSTIQITEDELNAYLEQEYRKKPHSGMKSASVKLFDGDRVAADSIVDVDEIKGDNSMGLKMLTWLMSGNQMLHAEARLIFKDNTVAYELERAQLNGVTLPNVLVEKLIEVLARRQSQKIDVTKPIPLSDSIKHVEINRGLLIIQT